MFIGVTLGNCMVKELSTVNIGFNVVYFVLIPDLVFHNKAGIESNAVLGH